MTKAILVDWGLYQTSTHIQRFLHRREGQASFVLLVNDPVNDDYSDDQAPTTLIAVEFDVVIRNTGELNDVKFKQRAFNVITDVSDLDIVIALDPSDSISEYYRENGVLITMADL